MRLHLPQAKKKAPIVLDDAAIAELAEDLPVAHVSHDNGSTAYRAFASCPQQYRMMHLHGGLIKRLAEDDPLDVGQSIHYGLMIAYRGIRDRRSVDPIRSVLAAMKLGKLSELSSEGKDRVEEVLRRAEPVGIDGSEVVAVEQRISIDCGSLEGDIPVYYSPTVDLVLKRKGPKGRSLLHYTDHKSSRMSLTDSTLKLFAADIQFIGMEVLRREGGWIDCESCQGSGKKGAWTKRSGGASAFNVLAAAGQLDCDICSGHGNTWFPPSEGGVYVNHILSRPPWRVSMERIIPSEAAVRSFKRAILDLAERRARLWKEEKEAKLLPSEWPRVMSGMGSCSSKFGTGRCAYYNSCFSGFKTDEM